MSFGKGDGRKTFIAANSLYLVYVGMASKQASIREFWYMLGGGQSKSSVGSLGICWEGGGAYLH